MSLLDVLASHLRRLYRDQSGVALMMTLAVFLILYVLCAGVFTIGDTVRQKIELQNACDSAAYSAAVAQADGLSRMAMLNRAMSWTYVRLTNMQIDFITYRWLELVVKRFHQDENICREFNSKTEFDGIDCPFPYPTHKCKTDSDFKENGIGWLCGVAGRGPECVRLNNQTDSTPIKSIEDALKKSKDMVDNFELLIPQFKQMIGFCNIQLHTVCTQMLNSVANTSRVTLYANLPHKKDGTVDSLLGRDFLGYDAMTYPDHPYALTNDVPAGVGYFSPLYNTELDERIFLTMADGEVYDNLCDYFGPSGSNTKKAGGLDQWFVRGWEKDTDADVVGNNSEEDMENGRLTPSSLGRKPSRKTFKNVGICRAYRNANMVGAENPPLFRANHCGLGDDDVMPSCINTRSRWPDKCKSVADSTALCADYEWCSGRYNYYCIHLHVPRPKGGYRCVHTHHYNDLLGNERWMNGSCSHLSDSIGPHRRSEYCSCFSKKKSDMASLVPEDSLVGGLSKAMMLLPVMGWGCSGEPKWSVRKALAKISVNSGPNGFARIYGDDNEIYKKYRDYYVGEPAMPWILNDRFYAQDGAIVVGLARKMRNPWTWLLNAVEDVVKKNLTGEKSGIYSMFNPKDMRDKKNERYIVAFAAARAAHRTRNSAHGEYETRYDAVCERDDRFSIDCSDGSLRQGYVGCVCGNASNQERFKRCWNLCETDWDATLLPLRFAYADARDDAGDWYDSLNDKSVHWIAVGRNSNGEDPIAEAAHGLWTRFFDDDGNVVTEENPHEERCSFLEEADKLISGRIL